MKLFFNYSIDCETPTDELFDGPENWDVAEASTRGFIETMDTMGVHEGATLFVYPDVARKQSALYRELAKAGVEIALHLHTMRYSKWPKRAWLGSLAYEEQVAVIGRAKQDLEEALGIPCLGFKACYNSADNFTFPALEALGFAWSSTSGASKYNPEIFQCWAGGWPFPYHPSRKNKLVAGDMTIYEMPPTRGIGICFQDNPDRPVDMRAETLPEHTGPDHELFDQVIKNALTEMEKREQGIRIIAAASHNTNPFGDKTSYQRRNVEAVIKLAGENAKARGYTLMPAHFLDIKSEADRINAF